jgi:hypothetical protein
MRVTFSVVKFYSDKSGKCTVCGKRCSRTKEFYQTVNPFNKNTRGEVKTREEIYNELVTEAKAWRQEPVTHAKCEQLGN